MAKSKKGAYAKKQAAKKRKRSSTAGGADPSAAEAPVEFGPPTQLQWTMAQVESLAAKCAALTAEVVALRAERPKWAAGLDAMNGIAKEEHAEVKELREQCKRQAARILELQKDNRAHNLMLFGCAPEATVELVQAQLVAAAPELKPGDVQVELLPHQAGAAKRPIKLLCVAPGSRLALLRSQTRLRKATGLRLDVDLTPAEQAERTRQWPLTAKVKAAGYYWFWQGSSLRVRLEGGKSELASTWLKGRGGKGGEQA